MKIHYKTKVEKFTDKNWMKRLFFMAPSPHKDRLHYSTLETENCYIIFLISYLFAAAAVVCVSLYKLPWAPL